MNARPHVVVALLAASFACRSDAPLAIRDPGAPAFSLSAATTPETDPGRYLVLFKRAQTSSLSFRTQVSLLGGAIAAEYPQVGIAVIAGLDPAGARSLATRRDVDVIEPDVTFAWDDRPTRVQPVPAMVFAPQSATAPATAFLFPLQWNLRAIAADAAWAQGALGSPDVSVAILDSGIDHLWPDLAGRVDLSRSISLVPSDNALLDLWFGPGLPTISDLAAHGTFVASIVASNSNILAGVTTRTTLFAVKACGLFGCPGSAIVNGMLYAADQGADVINLSIEGGFAKQEAPGLVSIFHRVANYASSKGALIVVAAGNQAADLDHNGSGFHVFCDAANVVCVSATGPTAAPTPIGPFTNPDAVAPYTNYGRSAVGLAAPGGGVTSVNALVAGPCSRTALAVDQTGTIVGPACPAPVLSVIAGAGTSFAAPHVSGVAAQIVARIGRGKPAQVRAILQQTADDLGQPGTDPFYGKGRVNAARAVM